MAKLPNKPRSGQKTIAALYRSICQIIDYLPSLTVKGDGKSISVSNKDSGSIISVKNNNLSNWKYQGDYQKYIFGQGIQSEYDEEICSGLEGISKELMPQYVSLNISGDGTYISATIPSTITDPVIISYIGPVPSGGGGSGGIVYTPGSGISISGNVIQTTFEPGCDIWFWDHSNDGASPGNYITIENGLSAGFGIKFKDNNPQGDYHMHYIGVDLAGGDYISIVTGTNSAGTSDTFPTIRCNLSATGYIGLSTVTVDTYDTGAIITTNLHGDGTTVTIDNDGTIHSHASGGTGGQTLSAASGINIFASGGVDYIETTFRPGVDIYFWDHSSEVNPQNVITIQNGLSAGHGISYRDNDPQGDYHMHYIDVDISGGQWLDYNKDQATMSCKLTGDNTTVYIGNNGTISANVWQYSSGSGISVDNNNHTITLTADIPSPGASYTPGSGINITSQDVIQTSFEPGYDIWFWYHPAEGDYPAYITIQNGLSSGFGITYRDNDQVNGDYHQKFIDVNLHGGDYISVVTGTSTSNGTTVHDNYPTIRCNLSAQGYLGISTVTIDTYDTGAIITTNLHGDGTTVTIDNDGTIHSVGGGTIVASGVQYPNYQELHKDDYGSVSGIGISFMLPVESGANVCFYTGAGNDHAFATFASNELNEDDQYERATIYNGTPYQTSAAGWVRLSVFDDGQHQGECLEFTDHYSDSSSWNYSTPLYRFHGFKSLSGDGTTVFVNGNTISANVWQYSGDNTYIQVDNSTKKINWIGTLPAAGIGAPDYTKLQVNEDPSTYSGMGTTYLVPVKAGRRIKYQSTGNVVVAVWAPCEGSTAAASGITTSYKKTSEDGWCRFTVMDDGSTPGACLKLIVDWTEGGSNKNGVFPLHRFSSKLSGAYGIAIENNGIRNMIQAGTGLTSTALMSPAPNSVMTGIAFDLSAQYAADLASISGRLSATTNEDRILSSHNGTLSWQPNTASYTPPSTVYDMLAQGSGIQLTKLSDGKTKIDCTVQGGGGGSNEYIRWPNYANLHNNGNSISIQTNYTAGPGGGWLRVSYKGQPQQQGSEYCYSIMIDDNQIGMYTLNSALSTMGNTWILPIPPFSRFMVNFPTSKTFAYFDGSVYDSGDIQTLYDTLIGYCNDASGSLYNTEQQYNYAKSNADWAENDYTVYSVNTPPNIDPPSTYWNNFYEARNYVTGSVSDDVSGAQQYANLVSDYATSAQTEATRMINEGEDILERANEYATSAANMATSAANLVTAASGEADRCYNWYLSACNLSGVTPHPKTYANRDE